MKILFLNTMFAVPPWIVPSNQNERLQNILSYIRNNSENMDIVCVAELIYTSAQKTFRQEMIGLGFKYYSQPLDTNYKLYGGVQVFSKHNFVQEYSQPFHVASCRYSDCLASKGFLDIHFETTSQTGFHLILTHLQASPDSSDIRCLQLDEIATHVSNSMKKIPTKDTFILIGDWNFEPDQSVELEHLQKQIPFLVAPFHEKSHPFSIDPRLNSIAQESQETVDFAMILEQNDKHVSQWIDPMNGLSDHYPLWVDVDIQLRSSPFKVRSETDSNYFWFFFSLGTLGILLFILVIFLTYWKINSSRFSNTKDNAAFVP